jgi:hypothetical protein
VIGVSNDGMHNFGYPCSMPREVTIDGLFVEDSNHPEDYEGLHFFTDPEAAGEGEEELPPTGERPFPYKRCRKVTVRDLETASGRQPQISPSEELNAGTLVVEQQ